MKVTIDTNVIYQALYSSTGASHAILQSVRNGELSRAVSIPVFEEYKDVLFRKKTLQETGLSEKDMMHVLDFIALVGILTPIDFLWRPNLHDETDNKFVELALTSGSEYLITRNIKDYTKNNELLFDSFQITTPSIFLEKWREKNGE